MSSFMLAINLVHCSIIGAIFFIGNPGMSPQGLTIVPTILLALILVASSKELHRPILLEFS